MRADLRSGADEPPPGRQIPGQALSLHARHPNSVRAAMSVSDTNDTPHERILLDRSAITKILVVKLRAIGDVVLSTIVTKNLREAFPEAIIHYLTERPSSDIVRLNPYLNGGLVYDRTVMSGAALIRLVRRQRYDLIIDLFGNPRTALLTYLSGSRYRAGFRFRGRSYAYNIVVTPRGDRVHNTQFNLDALEALSIPIVDRSLHVYSTPDDERTVDAFLKGKTDPGNRLVCLNPGGGWYTKRWGIDRYAGIADRLVRETGVAVVLAWGPGEESTARDLASRMQVPAIIPPPTSLPELAALLRRCALMITNDSGPMHVAAAVGTPVIGIYGPTNPQLQGPYGSDHAIVQLEGLSCLGCNLTSCPIGHRCMVELEIEPVLMQALQLLSRTT